MRLLVIHIMLLFTLFVPAVASAQTPPAEPPSKFSTICSKAVKDPNNSELVLKRPVSNIIRCAQKVINKGGDRIINVFTRFFANVVFYTMILAIMAHGIRMLMGSAKHHGVTTMLIVKIVVALFFCSPQGYWYMQQIKNGLIMFPQTMSGSIMIIPENGQSGFMAFLSSFVDDISSMICTSTGDTNIPSFTGMFDNNPQTAGVLQCPTGNDIFDKLDVILLKLMGVPASEAEIPANDKGSSLFIGIVVLGMGLIAVGTYGAMVGAIILTYVTVMLFAVAQLALYFIVVAVMINILAAFTPLMLACMFFQQTSGITARWFNLLLVYTIQPVVFAGFLFVILVILQPVAKDFSRYYEKVHNKYSNTSGQPGMKAKLFDCIGLSGANSFSGMSTQQMFSAMQGSSVYQNLVASGSATPAQGADKEKKGNCDISIFAIKLDKDITRVDENGNPLQVLTHGISPEGYDLYQKDVNSLMAMKLGVVILMVVLASLVKKLPEMMDSMMGAGSAGIGTIVERPTNFVMHGVTGASSFAGKVVRGGIGR